MKKPILTALALCALLLTVASLAMPATAQEEGTTQSTTHEVTVTGTEFTPSDLSINKVDTVYFHWSDTNMAHHVTMAVLTAEELLLRLFLHLLFDQLGGLGFNR